MPGNPETLNPAWVFGEGLLEEQKSELSLAGQHSSQGNAHILPSSVSTFMLHFETLKVTAPEGVVSYVISLYLHRTYETVSP